MISISQFRLTFALMEIVSTNIKLFVKCFSTFSAFGFSDGMFFLEKVKDRIPL